MDGECSLEKTLRTTLNLGDDVLAAAREMAAAERKTVGEVISALVRKALRTVALSGGTRNGIPLLPVRPVTPIVTSELVRQLQNELL
jgi:hypothetical protein